MSATTMRNGNSGGQQQHPGKRNILSNAAYSIFSQSSINDYARHGPASTSQQPAAGSSSSSSSRRLTTTSSSSYLQRSTSADNVQIVRQRGFKPSDRHDPAKRNFLESLTSKILHFDMDSGSSTPINLQKLLTPATDSNETLHLRNKKMYASSYFYAPSHPTVEDQVELARRISSSLSDVKNVKSKGQSMYVNRKKRSVKWIHDGNGLEDEEDASTPAKSKDKVPLKCMMNPGGKCLDYHGIQALGEEPNIPQVPPHPERLYDIVRDLNNQKGRGAEIFAKRRKRSEKWVVDAESPQSPSTYGYGKYPAKQDISGGGNGNGNGSGNGVNDHLNFDNKPFYNPFDLSMDYSSPVLPNYGHQCSRASFGSAHSDCGPCAGCGSCGPCGPCSSSPYGLYPTLYPPPYGPSYGPAYPACAPPVHQHQHQQEVKRKKKLYPPPVVPADPTDKLFRRGSFDGLPRAAAAAAAAAAVYGAPAVNGGHGNGHARPAMAPARNPKAHHQQSRASTNAGQQQLAMRNGFSYLNGMELQKRPAGHHLGRAVGNGYRSNGYNGGSMYAAAAAAAGQQNGSASQHQRSNGYQQQQQQQQQPNVPAAADDRQLLMLLEDDVEQPTAEDYTPVPVKQLIQEFEKTCRPVMQFKHYAAGPPALHPVAAAGAANGHGDLSRYFDSRRQVCYRRVAEDQQRAGNGYAHSSAGDDEQDDDEQDDEDDFDELRGLNGGGGGGDDEEEEEDDDDDASLDDSLSPVDFFCRAEQPTQATNGHGNNRSSSMSTIDDYYRRQQLQQTKAKYVDTEAEPAPGVRAANLAAAVSQSQITAQRKDLKKTPVLENLVAGTTTPECFKETFTEDIATKLSDNLYHGPKISSYQNLTNYNTAPRGWDQSQKVYRPIRFEKPQDTKISYSDF